MRIDAIKIKTNNNNNNNIKSNIYIIKNSIIFTFNMF